jgi:hypothetical protein
VNDPVKLDRWMVDNGYVVTGKPKVRPAGEGEDEDDRGRGGTRITIPTTVTKDLAGGRSFRVMGHATWSEGGQSVTGRWTQGKAGEPMNIKITVPVS